MADQRIPHAATLPTPANSVPIQIGVSAAVDNGILVTVSDAASVVAIADDHDVEV
jgi:hypothetical protein